MKRHTWIRTILQKLPFFGTTLILWLGSTSFAYAAFNPQAEANIEAAGQIVTSVAVISGVCFILNAFFKFKKMGEQRSFSGGHSIGEPLILLMVGALLLAFPTILKIFLGSVFSQVNDITPTTNEFYNDPALLMLIRLFGVISFVRGLMMFAKAGKESAQPGTVGKGFMFLVAGACMVHIVDVTSMLSTLF